MTSGILEKLSVLLPAADPKVLEIVVETAVQQILNYTNLDVLPEGLIPAAVMISKAYYEQGGFSGDTAAVTSVKRGDVQTNFGAEKTAVSFAEGGGFFGHREMLNPFRVLKFHCSGRGVG